MADVVINVGAVSAITAGTGLTGGTITGTGTIAADFGTTAGTVCQGNDSRLTAPVAPLAHASTHTAAGSDPLTLSQSQITSLSTDLAAKVAGTRQVIAGTGLGGGGALSADVTLNVSYGSSGTTACVGNDARLSNDRTPSTHASTHATGGTDVLTLGQAQISGLVTALSNKALGATVMTAGTGLTGGGDLSTGRTFAVAYGTTSTTATVGDDARLSFLAAGTGATSRTLQNKLRDTVSVKDFGAVGDGVTDDHAAIQAAISSCITLGNILFFPDGVYAMSSFTNSGLGAQIVASPTGDVKMTANSATILCTAATQAAFMFYFQNTSGYDLDISGITFDANLLAQVCLKRDEYSQGVASVSIDRCTFINAYGVVTGAPVSSPLWFTSSGVELYGGFRFVNVTNSQFINIKRAPGGTVNYATTGFSIGLDQYSTTYPQNVNVSGCYFADINNNQITNVAENANADGLKLLGGFAVGSVYIPSTATISNNHFVNCQGRAIKIQNDESTIFGNTIRYAVRPISGGTSQINCQLECGIVSNNVFHYDAAPSNTNPFAITFGDTGHSPIGFYSGNATTRARMYTITDNIVLNNVPTATGVMLAFAGWTEGTATALPVYATVQGNKISGKMKVFCNPTTRTSGGIASANITNNSMTELVSAFMASSAGCNFATTRFDVTGNVNSGSAVAHLVDSVDYTTILAANFSADRNLGIGLTASKLNINGAGFLPRLGTLVDPDLSSGGGISVQSIVLADDETYAFPRSTYMANGASMRMLTSSWGGATNFLFLHGDSTITSVSAGSLVAFANTSNPDTDTKVNVWIQGSATINIKNRLGDSCVFTLITLG